MPVTKTDRESIIKDAIHLFKVHGYYNTTMANIGDACGLIKGSIYHHFKSKEELALACMRYIHEYFHLHIFSIAGNNTLSASDKLSRFTDAIEQYFLHSDGGCLLGNFALEVANNIPQLKREIESYFNDWRQSLFEILKTDMDKKEAMDCAHEIVAKTQGAIMMMRLYGTSKHFKSMNNRIRALIS
jgi:AcrR family transcriptional regulator